MCVSSLYEVKTCVYVCVCVTSHCMRYIGGCWQPHTQAFDTGGGLEERGRWSSLFSLFNSNNDDCELPFPCSKVQGNSKIHMIGMVITINTLISMISDYEDDEDHGCGGVDG